MQRVPALAADARPQRFTAIAQQLAPTLPEAALVADSSPAEVARARAALLADGFVPDTAHLPALAVSGDSPTGLLSAAALAAAGHRVTVVAPRTAGLGVEFTLKQSTLDTFELIQSGLAARVSAAATALPGRNWERLVDDPRTGFPRRVRGEGDAPGRAPDPARAPSTGAEVSASPFTHVISAHRLNEVVREAVRERHGDRLTFEEGHLTAEVDADCTAVEWGVKRQDGRVDPLLGGAKPPLLIAAEGEGGTTLTSLGVETAPSTPPEHWISARTSLIDKTGEGSVRVFDRRGRKAAALCDGVEGTALLVQLEGAAPPEAQLRELGAKLAGPAVRDAELKGPSLREGSVPAPFVQQGRTARHAAQVTPEHTVVGCLGDGLLTSSFNTGGGLNTAIAQVSAVLTLAAELQVGLKPVSAARHFQRTVFDFADAFSATGISHFLPCPDPLLKRQLETAHRHALRDWRQYGGDSPYARLTEWVQDRAQQL
jgi:2-polyprenyl-6-methoxyphenol hydroxylase-like FAD-dependent oxidoreductase